MEDTHSNGACETESHHSASNTVVSKCFAQNSGRPNFDPIQRFAENARIIAELELQLAPTEKQLEKTAAETFDRLQPDVHAQILATFQICKLVHEGDLSQEFVDDYVRDSGIKAHQNERIRYSRLITALFATAQRMGAPPSRRSRSRICTYASAINFVLDSHWSDAQFEEHLCGTRRNGERHGIDFLAAEERRRRNGNAGRNRFASLLAKVLQGLGMEDGDLGLIVVRKAGDTFRLVCVGKRRTQGGGDP